MKCKLTVTGPHRYAPSELAPITTFVWDTESMPESLGDTVETSRRVTIEQNDGTIKVFERDA